MESMEGKGGPEGERMRARSQNGATVCTGTASSPFPSSDSQVTRLVHTWVVAIRQQQRRTLTVSHSWRKRNKMKPTHIYPADWNSMSTPLIASHTEISQLNKEWIPTKGLDAMSGDFEQPVTCTAH